MLRAGIHKNWQIFFYFEEKRLGDWVGKDHFFHDWNNGVVLFLFIVSIVTGSAWLVSHNTQVDKIPSEKTKYRRKNRSR
jgi:hypothetical protein